MTQGFTLFETPIGLCGLAWGERGLVGAQLPEAAPGAAWDRLRRRYPDAVEASPPPASVQRTVERINDLLAGGRDDLDAYLTRLKAKGVTILKRDDAGPAGKFAWILDPDGTKIELWEPKAE